MSVAFTYPPGCQPPQALALQAGLFLKYRPITENLFTGHQALESNRAESHPGSTIQVLCHSEQTMDSTGTPISHW